MASELVAFERMLEPLKPHFAQALAGAIPVDRLVRSVVISIERLPSLMKCDRQSILNAAMSAACLGLEVDGVTGQAYLLPFGGRAQLVIGYKGYNTMAARSGITITGRVVREGDAFDYDLAEGWVTHKKQLGGKGAIIAAWAKAAANGRPSVVEVLDVDELEAVRKKSPGAKRSDSPWNDPHIGYPAMCEKTAKRRLARSLPLNIIQLAARIDEAVDEQGKGAWIDPARGLQIEGEAQSDVPRIHHEQRGAVELLAPDTFKTTDVIPSAADYCERWRIDMQNASNASHGKKLADTWNAEKIVRDQIEWPDDGSFERLQKNVRAAIEALRATA